MTIVFKKGNAVLDTTMFLIVMLAFALIIFIGKTVLSETNVEFQNDDTMTNESKQVISDINTNYTNIFDYAFLTFFILMWALIIVASFNIDAHPIFFIFTIILMIFILGLSVYLGNVYEEVAIDEFSSVYSSFPIAHYIMSHLLQVILAVGFSTALVLFAKNIR